MCAGTLTRPDTAFMGFYAVEIPYQGIGVGRELWAATTKRLGESMNIGLYGVPAMSAKYKKSGFNVEDTVRMLIFESQPGQEVRLDLLASLGCLSSSQNAEPGERFELRLVNSETDEQTLRKLIEFDHSVNNFSREKLLRNYLASETNAPLSLALVRLAAFSAACCEPVDSDESSACCAPSATETADATSKLSRQMSGSLSLAATGSSSQRRADAASGGEVLEVLAYGCLRHDNTGGGMIGPIYADSAEACEVILRHLLERFEFRSSLGKYSAMTLTSNNLAADILQRVGLREMDQCSRMFTKFVPEAQANKVFYVHSPNFTLF